ncbi:MAG: hypothetical protein RR015_04070, partial [Bacteroidales bacterium]
MLAEEKSEQIQLAYEVQLLEDLQILKMQDIGIEDTKQIVSKAQFIKALINITQPKYVPQARYNPYTDLDRENMGYQEIIDAYALGILKTNGTSFEPNRWITLREAAELAVSALGYDSTVSNGAYYEKAQELKLFRSIKAVVNESLSFDNMAKLFANIIKTPICQKSFKGAPGTYTVEISEDVTVLSKCFDIVKIKGIVSENAFTTLETSRTYNPNHIMVAGVEGKIYTTDDSVNYIGMYVEAYYRETEDGENIFLHIKLDEKKNEIYSLRAEDVASFAEGVLTYEGEKREEKITIPASVSIIYNGKQKQNDDANIFYFNEGEIIVVDNNSDKKADVITVNSYKDMIVTGKSGDGESITGDGEFINLYPDDENFCSYITNDANEIIAYDDIAEKDILTYFVSEDGMYVRIKVSKNIITDKISKYDCDEVVRGSAECRRDIAIIDGNDYEVSANYADFRNEAKCGIKAEFYINYYGKLVKITTSSYIKYYGFIIKIYEN